MFFLSQDTTGNIISILKITEKLYFRDLIFGTTGRVKNPEK